MIRERKLAITRLVPGAWLAIALGLLAGCGGEQEVSAPPVVRPVKVLKLVAAEDTATRQFPGQVRASKRADLSFEVAGKLQELPIREGQVLEKGDLVAALDDRDFASAQKSAQAEFSNALANFRRGSVLVKDGNISKTEFDRLKSRRDVTSANLAKAEKALADTRLTAPFGGRVANRFVENFQDVQAKEPIVSLQDIEELEVLIDVPESQLIRATRPGMARPKMSATFDASPGKQFELAIKEYSTEADPTTQSFRVVLSMVQPEEFQALPGMTVMVAAQSAAGDAEGAGYVIPAIAVFADETGQSQVWVVDPPTNRVQSRIIGTGRLVGSDSIRVESGLKSGEMVVVAAVSRLREGMEVRPIEQVAF